MDVNFEELGRQLEKLGIEYLKTSQFIQLEDEDYEILIFKSGRMVARGAEEEREAKNLFARYLGGWCDNSKIWRDSDKKRKEKRI